MATAEIDDAEAVAIRVGEHHEVRVVGIAVPVDWLSSDDYEPLGDVQGRIPYCR